MAGLPITRHASLSLVGDSTGATALSLQVTSHTEGLFLFLASLLSKRRPQSRTAQATTIVNTTSISHHHQQKDTE